MRFCSLPITLLISFNSKLSLKPIKQPQQIISHIAPGNMESSKLNSHHKKKRVKTEPLSSPSPKRTALSTNIKVEHEDIASGEPTRNGDVFTFQPSPDADSTTRQMISSFHPNRSPEEVLRAGAFGGTYFRTIKSGVCQKTLTNAWKELPPKWIEGLNVKEYLTRPWKEYDKSLNKFGVKAGTTLEDWESSGWISHIDPFGWFQWYCRFFQGRRSSDDERQIDRWLKCCGPKGRWKSNLCGKIIIAGAQFDDPQISPVVRQTLLHWGYELSESDFEEVKQRLNKGKGAYFINKDQLNSAIGNQKKS
mmetsp:Transcript_32019/g.37623  ORF Transcript_32019/g.37623 Transcript_32019/m.37623 type:complete len:306 (-) Transcript_32019:143-1060(-)